MWLGPRIKPECRWLHNQLRRSTKRDRLAKTKYRTQPPSMAERAALRKLLSNQLEQDSRSLVRGEYGSPLPAPRSSLLNILTSYTHRLRP